MRETLFIKTLRGVYWEGWINWFVSKEMVMGRRIPASRKIVNALLSMVLVLGLMPAPAFAGGGGCPQR